ncbi:hypothetical protein LINPERPRIM_LOCUS24396, partial [Linum perenne]
ILSLSPHWSKGGVPRPVLSTCTTVREATITLEDVHFLTGLSVDGELWSRRGAFRLWNRICRITCESFLGRNHLSMTFLLAE